MVDIKKRYSLLVTLFGISSNVFSNIKISDAPTYEYLSTDLSKNLKLCEFLYVLNAWQQSKLGSPLAYLEERHINQSNFHRIVRQDFIDNKVLTIKGLVLSRTEAALISKVALSYTIY